MKCVYHLASAARRWILLGSGIASLAWMLFSMPATAQAAPQDSAAADPDIAEAAGEAEEAEVLFDGETLTGWSGDERFWSVADGAIVGQTTEETPLDRNTFLIWQGGEVRDFRIELEFRLTSGNSGLQIRAEDKGEHRVAGYQADFDAANRYTGIFYDEGGGRGILVPRGRHVVIGTDGERTTSDEATCSEDALLKSLKQGEWNTCTVTAEGSQLTHEINGMVTAVLEDGEEGKAATSGIIALQLHTGPPMKVEFRNIRLTRLNP